LTAAILLIGLVVFIFQNGNSREILGSNHLELFLILVLYPGQMTGTSDPYTVKKTGTPNLFHGT
jgi:hypothetical protein